MARYTFQMRRPRFGLTILEFVVACIAVVFIGGIVIMSMSSVRSGCSRSLRDATQIEQIHQAMLIFAREFDGIYPTPGLIARLPDPITGVRTPGRGEEDVSLNHTAPLYSAMIAQNYVTPELLISPLEPSEFVRVWDKYNYQAYDPAGHSYWDAGFSARVDQLDPGSNVSYAHMALCGERKVKYWRDNMAANTTQPILGNRGPENGATSGDKYKKSITLQIHEPDDEWTGNISFADGRVEFLDSLELAALQTPGQSPFNLFRMDGGALGVSIASTAADVTRVWDPLE